MKSGNFREAIVVKLILVTVCEGKGTEEDVYRLVHYYCDFNGNVLFAHDPVEDKEQSCSG